MRDGHDLIGYGMATATYPTNRSKASARATIGPDGIAVVQSGTQDLGTGTWTVMAQVAADALGFPLDKVRFELGDTRLPAGARFRRLAERGQCLAGGAGGLRSRPARS